MTEKPPDPREFGYLMSLAQVGLEMVAVIIIGIMADSYFGLSPWGVICGAVLGLVGGLAHLVSIANRPPGSKESRKDSL